MIRPISITFGLFLALLSPCAYSINLDSTWLLTSPLAQLLPAETLMDNSNQGTAQPRIPGAVFSGGEFNTGFGLIFTAGPSSYALKSMTMQIASFAQEPSFQGALRVSLYRMGEGTSPNEPPVFERIFRDIEFPAREGYVSLDLSGALLSPGIRYGLILSAPNQFKARIFGHQIPDVSPTSPFGFAFESGLWGSSEAGWRRQLYPLIWVQGWDLQNDSSQKLTRLSFLFAVAIGLLIGGLILMRKRGRLSQS